MELSTECPSAKPDDLIARLREDLKDRGRDEIVVGYSGYDPFVTVNGQLKAPLLPFFEELGQVAGLPIRYQKSSWTKFAQEMRDHAFDTMLEPIIPTRDRLFFGVVPYMEIICCVLVVPEKISAYIKEPATAIRALTTQLAQRSIDPQSYTWEVQERFHQIAAASGGSIGVTAGVLEQDVLEEFGVDVTAEPPDDIRANIVKWVGQGKCFLADNNSAKAAESDLRMVNKRVRRIHIFQDKLGASCGFAVNRMANRGLADFLTYKCRFELQKIHELLSETPEDTFDGDRFRLIAAETVPRLPLAGTNLSLVVQSNTSRMASNSKGLIDDSVISPELGENVNANHRHAHVSLNIQNLKVPLDLADVLAITRDWDVTNKRRLDLIEQRISNKISPAENAELHHLQKLAGAKRQLVMPLPIAELAVIEASLRRRGMWRGR